MKRLALAFAIAAAPAVSNADLWGYVDEEGRAHFAAERLDERYTLFYKGRTSLDALREPGEDGAALERLRGTALYRRVSASPNVARFSTLIESQAKRYAVDAALVKALIAVESAFDPQAISDKGAVGLMQVLPETAQRYGLAADAKRSVAERLLDPATNVAVGTRYLSDLLARFADDLALALAAYNAGEGAVDRHASVPPFADTQAYVRRVQDFYRVFRPRPEPPAPRTPSRIAIPRDPRR